MKKFVSLVALMLAAASCFAAKGFCKIDRNSVYVIYKVEIRDDLNRDFYSKTFGYPESAAKPHITGLGKKINLKPLFGNYDCVKTEFYAGSIAGEFAYDVSEGKKNGTSWFKGVNLNLFGERLAIMLPLQGTFDSYMKAYELKYEDGAKYVYIGTMVYDFIDGTIEPQLVEVRDEYEEAQAWVNENAKGKAILCRGEFRK